MRETREHTIDGQIYSITQLGAKQGRLVLARVLRIVAGAAGAAQSVEDPVEAAAAAAAKLASALTDDEVNYLCDVFSKATQVTEGAKGWALSDIFDDHFAGRYGAMLQWLWAALETNYSSFLSDVGLNVPALANAAKKAMTSTPQSPTPPSGASS